MACSGRAFLSLWISRHPFESQAAGIWAASSSSDGLGMNSDILIYYLQMEIAAAGRSIIHYSCLYYVPQKNWHSYKNILNREKSRNRNVQWYLFHCSFFSLNYELRRYWWRSVLVGDLWSLVSVFTCSISSTSCCCEGLLPRTHEQFRRIC